MQIPLPGRFQILHQRNFRLYWVGQLVSLTGMWMQAVASSLLVLELTDSAFALAIVNFAVAIPGLLLTLYGGVAADRYERRTIMVITQVALMVVAIFTGVLVAAGAIEFWQIVVISVFIGIAMAFDMPAQQALVPSLVEPKNIPEAIALNQVIFNGSRMVGPAIAGVLIAVAGYASSYFANGISYLAVIASLLLLRLPKGDAGRAVHGSALSAMKEGIGHVWRSPLLRSLMGMSGAMTFLIMPCLAVLSPAYARDALAGGPGITATLMAASGAASMVGAAAMLWVPAARRGVTILACIVLQSLALAVMASVSNVPVAVIAFAGLSLGMGLVFGLNMTTVQQVTPDQIRGRVMSVSGLMFSGVMPLATILVGVLVELLTIRTAYAICGGIYLFVAGYALWRSGLLGGNVETLSASAAAEPQPVAAR